MSRNSLLDILVPPAVKVDGARKVSFTDVRDEDEETAPPAPVLAVAPAPAPVPAIAPEELSIFAAPRPAALARIKTPQQLQAEGRRARRIESRDALAARALQKQQERMLRRQSRENIAAMRRVVDRIPYLRKRYDYYTGKAERVRRLMDSYEMSARKLQRRLDKALAMEVELAEVEKELAGAVDKTEGSV